MREIVLDTETTGLDPLAGHRVIEIGCVELYSFLPTGQTRQFYLNPDRDIPEESFKVHGLSAAFLADKPRFPDVVEDFLAFIGDSPLIIHNADFDLRFLNAELRLAKRPPIAVERAIDTVHLARSKFPGAQVNLDALCRRFEIDLTARVLHGALLDCELLAAVYLELRGGRQPGLVLDAAVGTAAAVEAIGELAQACAEARPPRQHRATEAELAAHAAMLAQLKNPIWLG